MKFKRNCLSLANAQAKSGRPLKIPYKDVTISQNITQHPIWYLLNLMPRCAHCCARVKCVICRMECRNGIFARPTFVSNIAAIFAARPEFIS